MEHAAESDPAPVVAIATPPQRTHPLTIAVHGLRGLPILALAWVLIVNDQARSIGIALILGLPLLAGLAVAGAYLRWSRTWYFFDETGDFRLDSGVLQRRQRRLALSRLQSVDVVRPLLARLVGMSSVRVEVAGSGDSVAVVEYLPEPAAEALRAEVLARASGAAGGGEPAVAAQPEDIRLRVATGDLITSLLLRGSSVTALVLTVLGVLGVLAVSGPAGFLIVGFGVFVPVVTVISEFTTYYQFTLARSDDGLRLRHGLLSTVGQTVPPGRVHAIEFSQPFLWRSRDWVRVSLNVAGGRGEGENSSSGPRVLVPVATAAEAREIVALILPDWETAHVSLAAAPPSARLRAPIQHRMLRYGQGEEVLVTTRGRFVRRTAVIAHARVQSLRVIQGPWQRRLGLGTMRADTVPGPVVVAARHIPVAQARALADDEAVRMRVAARRSGPGRWRSGGAAPAPPAPDAWSAPDPAHRLTELPEQPGPAS
jgi:putative membrane protein